MHKAVILLACACALLVAAASAAAVSVTPTQADTNSTQAETNTDATAASEPRARAAGDRLRTRYRRWRHKLDRYGVWRGRDLIRAAASNDRALTARELRRSIWRMKRRFANWSKTYEGRATVHRFKVRRIPDWGRENLSSIAWCESHNNPRAIGGGGRYRGMYQMTFSIWGAVGGHGDPAAAPAAEQYYRAALIYTRYGSGQWPVCGR